MNIRYWVLAGSVVLACSISAIGIGHPRATTPDDGILTANGLRIIGPNGDLRLLIETAEDHTSIVVFDANRVPRTVVGVVRTKPHVDLYDHDGNARMLLTVGEDGPRMNLRDSEGCAVLAIGDSPDLGPHFGIREPDGGGIALRLGGFEQTVTPTSE